MVLSVLGISQDKIKLSNSSDLLNHSIADQFSIAEDPTKEIGIEEIRKDPEKLTFTKLKSSLANLDFTTSNYWIQFELENEESSALNLVLETARPITNTAVLYELSAAGIIEHLSGDGIPFEQKSEQSNRTLFRIYLPAKATKKFWLKLGSDGEIISLPMIFWEASAYQSVRNTQIFFVGIFYGIFFFVGVIYLTFYFILKDLSFIYYVLYVFFSGMLQFGLDGFAHEYFFQSGGYFTQHFVLFAAGFTVLFVLLYASKYLKTSEYSPKWHKAFQIFAALVLFTILISLIPGKTYELAYPMINGMSLLATLLVLIASVVIGMKQKSVNYLFVSGIVVLILGAVIFILGNFSVIDAPQITQNSLKVATLIEILCLSIVMAGKYKTLQEEKEAAQALLLKELEGINVRLEKQVKERTAQIEQQKHEIEQKNHDLLASIVYAERIQRAILPSDNKFKALLPDSFVFFQPRDIVSGDFYWIESVMTTDKSAPKEIVVYATADCTGHGVPGAFVSIVGNNLLNLSKTNVEVNTPGEALDFLNAGINKAFNADNSETQIRDGMDIALCAIDKTNRKLLFSGAKNPLYLVRGGELIAYIADKMPIGNIGVENEKSYTTHEIDLIEGDIIYTFSDGFADQFGGDNGKKYKYSNFKEFLVSISDRSMSEQFDLLKAEFFRYKGNYEQLDDVLVIGVKVQ